MCICLDTSAGRNPAAKRMHRSNACPARVLRPHLRLAVELPQQRQHLLPLARCQAGQPVQRQHLRVLDLRHAATTALPG